MLLLAQGQDVVVEVDAVRGVVDEPHERLQAPLGRTGKSPCLPTGVVVGLHCHVVAHAVVANLDHPAVTQRADHGCEVGAETHVPHGALVNAAVRLLEESDQHVVRGILDHAEDEAQGSSHQLVGHPASGNQH